jgi:PhnB protein
MGATLNPYLSFTDNARQALQFYQGVLGGELTLNTFGSFGAEGPDAEKIMHGTLVTDKGFTLMAADTPTGMDHKPGTNITVSISGDDAADLRSYWDGLSASGTVTVPFEKQAWGDEFGACVDQFGIPWMVNVTQAR